MVQKHAASQLHYDFRLEMNGVLVSWAIPKGPSPNPQDKRFAVHVEDHPVEYGDFEGLIPAGNYGAGAVICWDRGTWVPLEDPEEGWEKGKLLFELRGHKLHGNWTLVKTKQGPKDWLLIKERDRFASDQGTESYPDDSIFSGLTVEELGKGASPAEAVAARLAELGARESPLDPRDVSVMLAESRDEAFSREGWLFEIKYDGYRILASHEGGEGVLISRNGNDLTETFPEIGRAVRGLPCDGIVLDGEVVVHDPQGLPSFSRLQKRGRLQRRRDVLRAAVELPATYYAFDLLAIEGYDLRPLPLATRKELLRRVLPSVGPVRYSDHIPDMGEAMYEQAVKMRLEGIVAKKAESPYRAGRSADWIKVRTLRMDDFVVVGFTDPKGSRGGFGALHLAQYDGQDLVYTGRVGTGFSAEHLEEIGERLLQLEREDCPCSGEVPKRKAHHWVDPLLVAEVRYKELTEAGQLRHPSFVRLRDDKPPSECAVAAGEAVLEEPAPIVDRSVERVVPFSNPDKVFWPEEGYTKGDLIEYYRRISPWLLPYLHDRPVVLTRYPDGIEGKSFFQKNAPGFVPEWMRMERFWIEDEEGGREEERDYFVCSDQESLLYVANLASIPLHVWSSRVETLSQPDWCVLDLDPKEAPLADVVQVALLLREVCQEIGLPSFVKTSGSSGLHVLIPLGRQCTYEQSRTLGHLLATVVASELPDIATTTRHVSKRGGKVYVDYLQNGYGKLLVSPFCVRPLPGAPVSMPLRWDEVTTSLDIRAHTIRNAPERMKSLREDPLDPVLEAAPDLMAALDGLTRRFER